MAEFAHDLDAQRRLRDIEKRMATGGPPTDNGGMEARVTALEEAVKNLPTKADLDGLRLSSEVDAAKLRADFEKSRADTAKASGDLRGEFEKLRGDVSKGFAELRADMHKNTVDIQRWMIVTVISLFLGFSGLFFTMSNNIKSAPSTTITQPTPQPPIIINVPAPAPAPVANAPQK